ncbi:YoaK family protein [Arthrobacter antioxidans]|uniref:YoaK family protein n=1 Tax=Arthrobacter antioxidans TaxID=2895818 RepID=UPI001FFF9955|nr:YoaK family protein [Arthrobacter antioxidans]
MTKNRVVTDRLHLWLMLILTFSTGVIDAVGYLGLDRVFTGNMTGNVVLLGMAFTGGADLPILRPALALVFFMVGAALAGRVLRKGPEGWSGRTSITFLTVTVGLTALAVYVALVDVAADELLGSITTSVLATVMGVQAATAKRLKVAEITTVVVTSTITGLASDSRLAGGKSPFWARRAAAIALIMAGAVVGALTLRVDLWLGIAVSALLSAVVTLLGHLRHRQDVSGGHTENVGEAALR